jgi:hypothetical protein
MSNYTNPTAAGQEQTPPNAEPDRARSSGGAAVLLAEIGHRPRGTDDPTEFDSDARNTPLGASDPGRRDSRARSRGRRDNDPVEPPARVGARAIPATGDGSDPTNADGDIEERTTRRRDSNRRRANRIDGIPGLRERLAASTRAGRCATILGRHQVYVWAFDGDGRRFADVFRRTWRRLPLFARRQILGHWKRSAPPPSCH